MSPPVNVYVVVVVGETGYIPKPTGTFIGGLNCPPERVIDQQLEADQFKLEVFPDVILEGVAVKVLITQLLTTVVKFKVKVIVWFEEQFCV